MTKTIPWKIGSGNIILTFNGQGDDVVTVSSDTDNYGLKREQTLAFYVTDGAIRVDIATTDGLQLATSDGMALTALDESQKVFVTVVQTTGMLDLTASSVLLLDVNGRQLRVNRE